jgi:hypothetical protein
MNQTALEVPLHQEWLKNRIHAAISDDFYLDRDEEKRIKEEGAARGILIQDIEDLLRLEVDKIGAVSERLLLGELDRLLHQFTDSDKELDHREERDSLNRVVRPAPDKKTGLNNKIAEEHIAYFCKVNGVRRNSDIFNKRLILPLSVIAVLTIGAVSFYSISKTKTEFIIEKVTQNSVDTNGVNSKSVILTDKDKVEVDDLLRRATQFVEKAQYTDPPEKSAKACLDEIKQIDPNSQYRGLEVKGLFRKIVDHYIELADRSGASGDKSGASKWLDRAKLMNTDREVIIEKEKSLGLILNTER